MNYRGNDILCEKLASEYVLGTLKGGARRRFEAWLKNDAALKRTVLEWQEWLLPLAEMTPSIAPPGRVWRSIEKYLDAQAKPERSDWKDNVYFWRWLGIASTAVAASLVAVLLVRQPGTDIAAPVYVAMLTDEQARAAIVVKGNPQLDRITVRILTVPAIGKDKSLELWALPKDGQPRSLGLISHAGEITLKLPSDVRLESVPHLAVSVEPKGGSPNPNMPSGPVIFKGAWVRI